jgi:hypothetical protein
MQQQLRASAAVLPVYAAKWCTARGRIGPPPGMSPWETLKNAFRGIFFSSPRRGARPRRAPRIKHFVLESRRGILPRTASAG